MKKTIIQIAAGIMFLLGMTGCLDMQTTMIVKKDGSGYIVDTMVMGAQAAGMLAMAEANADGGKQENPMKPSKEDLETRGAELGTGVKLVSSKEIKKPDGSAGYKATYSFADVTKVKLAMPSGSKQNEEKKKDEVPVTFTFKKGQLTAKMPPKDPNAKPKEMTAEEKQQAQMGLGMMKGMMKGMRVRMMIKVDGAITKSNASHMLKGKKSGKNQYVVLYDINMDKLDDDGLMKVMSTQESGSPAEAAAALQGVKGVKIETAETVNIAFK